MPRDPQHDYRSRCIYHITISKAPAIPNFSKIIGPLSDLCNSRSPIGIIVEKNIRAINSYTPSLRILRYVIMPDHIHFILFAKNHLDLPIGKYLSKFKVLTGQAVRMEFPSITGPIFEKDFNDRILRFYNRLDHIFRYVEDNPRRLAARRANPDFFRRINDLALFGRRWQAYGNLQLLENPFKGAVIVHRRDSEETKARNREIWLHLAANGGVLVSPFISKDEKELRREAEAAGARIILLGNEPFGDRAKPALHDFRLCEQGRLLVLAPMEPLPPGRQTFLFLNGIAEKLAFG